MVKKRISIPVKTKNKVLKEFRHKCGVCGNHDPQLHHIDEDPSNNDPLNLIPLCPNCHLQDTHDPTEPIQPSKIAIFRRTRDPHVLDTHFHPIWIRLKFLRENDSERSISLSYSVKDLLNFVRSFNMGGYYSEKISHILKKPMEFYRVYLKEESKNPSSKIDQEEILSKDVEDFRATAIEDLCVEMLRYQNWNNKNNKNS